MANFAVRLAHGSGWDRSRQIRDQDAWDQHAAFMDGLVDDGFIILGGLVGDGEETLHVVEAADEKEIRARLAEDPWALAGPLRIAAIEPWALWLDSRPWKSGSRAPHIHADGSAQLSRWMRELPVLATWWIAIETHSVRAYGYLHTALGRALPLHLHRDPAEERKDSGHGTESPWLRPTTLS